MHVLGRKPGSNVFRPLVAETGARVVALDLCAAFDLEYTALKMPIEAEQRPREKGVMLWIVGPNPVVQAMLMNSPLGQALGAERVFNNLEEAVARYQAMTAGA
ncbi:hypothetical protein SAMN05216201_104169 [Pseudomonas linyingensis]|uniref:STAS domain-containing protein n=1 Tax=Pseudomonas linyingensis TaxID=915471 RepID=A0A1H6VRM4_9PSED|nr:hypothetical protein [Pseudomonas linyingensis]SEJ06366.1 hypothetical protein SAMN05216201_104169 [Pseudomonas linyingensis]